MGKGKVEELDIVGEIRNAFKCLNNKIFNDKIISPSIKVDANKNFMFRFSGNPNQHYELVIGHRLGSFDKNIILSNIVHEMIHALNYSKNVKGITSNRYHNKKFLTEALSAGLYVSREKSTGWSATSYKYLKDDDVIEHKLILKWTDNLLKTNRSKSIQLNRKIKKIKKIKKFSYKMCFEDYLSSSSSSSSSSNYEN